MIPVYNEADIVGTVIDHLISQGLQLVVLDGGSTDGSYEICSRNLGKGVLSLEKLVAARFELRLILETLYQMALRHSPDWVLLSDADEFHESPYLDLNLRDAIQTEEQRGCNLIQFNDFEFLPTERDISCDDVDVRRRLRYYTWNDDSHFRCWRICDGISVAEGGGHYPVFPKGVKIRVPRAKYVLRHYRIRSYEQGVKKVFGDRLPRYAMAERREGWHLHYDNFGRDEKFFIIDSRNLNRYDEDGRWVVKKTFDWTWGVQGRPWAKPPVPSNLKTRLAEKLPFAARVWKRIFLRKHSLPHITTRDDASERQNSS